MILERSYFGGAIARATPWRLGRVGYPLRRTGVAKALLSDPSRTRTGNSSESARLGYRWRPHRRMGVDWNGIPHPLGCTSPGISRSLPAGALCLASQAALSSPPAGGATRTPPCPRPTILCHRHTAPHSKHRRRGHPAAVLAPQQFVAKAPVGGKTGFRGSTPARRENLPAMALVTKNLSRHHPIDVIHSVDPPHGIENPLQMGHIPHLEDKARYSQMAFRGVDRRRENIDVVF